MSVISALSSWFLRKLLCNFPLSAPFNDNLSPSILIRAGNFFPGRKLPIHQKLAKFDKWFSEKSHTAAKKRRNRAVVCLVCKMCLSSSIGRYIFLVKLRGRTRPIFHPQNSFTDIAARWISFACVRFLFYIRSKYTTRSLFPFPFVDKFRAIN